MRKGRQRANGRIRAASLKTADVSLSDTGHLGECYLAEACFAAGGHDLLSQVIPLVERCKVGRSDRTRFMGLDLNLIEKVSELGSHRARNLCTENHIAPVADAVAVALW